MALAGFSSVSGAVTGTGASHALTLDSNNQISNNAVKINASYSLGVFSSNLTASSGSFATLAANGYFGSNSPLYRITNFTVTLSSGSIYAYFGHSAWSREEVFASASFSVGLASAVHPASSPSYFMLTSPAGCVISSIVITYDCTSEAYTSEGSEDLLDTTSIEENPGESHTILTHDSSVTSGSSQRAVHFQNSVYGSGVGGYPSVLFRLRTPITVKTGGTFRFDGNFVSGHRMLNYVLYDSNWGRYSWAGSASDKGEYTSTIDSSSVVGSYVSFSTYSTIQASCVGTYNASTNPYLSSFSVAFIRVLFDTENASTATSIYLDNFHYDSSQEYVAPSRTESVDEGLENCPIDTGASTAAGALDASKVYGSTSASALRASFSATGSQKITLNTETNSVYPVMNTGKLAGDFYFSGVDPSVSLVVSPYGWVADSTSLAFTLKAESNGWYRGVLECSSIVWNASVTDFRALRLWLTFPNVTETSGHVWVDNLLHTSTAVSLWKAYNGENLLQNVDYSTSANGSLTSRGSSLSLNAIKGEQEAIQLMVTPDSAVASYSFSMGNLSDGAGHSIAASSVAIYAERYLYVDSSASNETTSASGYYPDALVPLTSLISAGENSIAAGKNQGLYFVITLASSLTAGTYAGQGVLTLDETTFVVPFQIKVMDLSMPSAVHAKSSFLLWYDQIANYYGTASTELRKSYYDFMIAHRAMPDGLPEIYEGDAANGYTGFADNFATLIAPNDAINSYRLTFSKDSNGNLNSTDVSNELQALITKNIALAQSGSSLNLFSKCYFYFDDEPAASSYATVASNNQALVTVKNNLASQLNSYPTLKASFLAIPNIVTAAYPAIDSTSSSDIKKRVNLGVSTASSLLGQYYNESARYNYGINTWCPTYNNFDTAAHRSVYSTRQANGEHVWWYGCINPIQPYPTYHLNAPLLPSRMLSYMEDDYGIEGNLYWCANYFGYYNGSTSTTRDVWSNGNTWENCYGDGMLVYPGNKYSIDGPISTLRLESIREANEDYEYLQLFRSYIATYNSTYSGSKNASTLLATYYNQLFSNVSTACSAATFESVRESLLTVLGNMAVDLKTTVESL